MSPRPDDDRDLVEGEGVDASPGSADPRPSLSGPPPGGPGRAAPPGEIGAMLTAGDETEDVPPHPGQERSIDDG